MAQQARLARAATTAVPLDASRGSFGGGSSFRMTVTSTAGGGDGDAGLGALAGRETVVVAPAHNPLALPFASAERAAARFATAADHAARSLAAEWAAQQPSQPQQWSERRGLQAGGAVAGGGGLDVAPAWLRETAALRAGDTRGSFTPSPYTPASTAGFGSGVAAGGYDAATAEPPAAAASGVAGAPGGAGVSRSALLSTMKQRMDSIISSIDTNIARLSATGTAAPPLPVASGGGRVGAGAPPAAARGSRAA